MPQGPNRECETHRAPVGPAMGREGTRPGPSTMSQDSASLRRDTWVVVGESASELFAAKGEAASVLCAAEGEASAGGRGRSRRSDHGCGQGDPCRSRSGAKRSFQARRQGRGGASKPDGKDGAAVEVTAEVGASKPIMAGDVVRRAGHGPGESVHTDHGGDEASGPGPAGGTRCAVCRRAGPRIPAI